MNWEQMSLLEQSQNVWASSNLWSENNLRKENNAKRRKLQYQQMMRQSFVLVADFKGLKKGDIVRGTWFNDKTKLTVNILPPKGSKGMVDTVIIPIENVVRHNELVEFGENNILRAKSVVEKTIETVTKADVKLTDLDKLKALPTKDKFLFGAIIGLAIYGGLKIFKLTFLAVY